MKFSLLDKQTIQCIITESECADYGIDKKALFQNDAHVQEFFRKVMQQAEKKIGFRKKRGNVAVHASFLSDESLEITFSVENKPQAADAGSNGTAGGISCAVLKSKNLWDLIRFCEHSAFLPPASLYRYKDVYFLLTDIRHFSSHETAVLFLLADEYLDGVCYTPSIAAFLKEHGTCMVEGAAMEALAAKTACR